MTLLIGQINTPDNQPNCFDCDRPWATCPGDRVFPVPVFGEGITVERIAFVCTGCRNARLQHHDEELRCRGCGAPASATRPYLWKDSGHEHKFTHTRAIYQVTRCCGRLAHTEPVAFTCTYLHNAEANAKLICELVNARQYAEIIDPDWQHPDAIVTPASLRTAR